MSKVKDPMPECDANQNIRDRNFKVYETQKSSEKDAPTIK